MKLRFGLSKFFIATVSTGFFIAIFIQFELLRFADVLSLYMLCAFFSLIGRQVALFLLSKDLGVIGIRCIAWFSGVVAAATTAIALSAAGRISSLQDFIEQDLFDGGVFLASLMLGILTATFLEIPFACYSLWSKNSVTEPED